MTKSWLMIKIYFFDRIFKICKRIFERVKIWHIFENNDLKIKCVIDVCIFEYVVVIFVLFDFVFFFELFAFFIFDRFLMFFFHFRINNSTVFRSMKFFAFCNLTFRRFVIARWNLNTKLNIFDKLCTIYENQLIAFR